MGFGATSRRASLSRRGPDPTNFLSTGAIPAHGGRVFDGEGAFAIQTAYVQAEFFHYNPDRIGQPSASFNGGYVEASYSLGGKRTYKATTGAYSEVVPDHPLSFADGGLGAIGLT